MVVDDDPDDIDLFKEFLSEADNGCHLITANDGVDALRQLRTTGIDPDVIFLDYNMPLMNGMRCLVALKEDPLLMDIPVVMHSTTLPEEEVAFCKKLSVKVLPKQVVFAKAVYELNNILSEIRSRQSVIV